MSGTVLKNLAMASRLGDETSIAETIEASLAQQTSAIGALLEKQLVTEHDFLREICVQFRLPWWDAALPPMDDQLRGKFPARLALRYQVYPVRLSTDQLHVLTCDPFNLTARQVIAHEIDEPITWCVTTRRNILAA